MSARPQPYDVKSPAPVLFYETLTAISLNRHRDVYIDDCSGFEYAKSTNSVPVSVGEFGNAASVYPIVFLEDESGFRPVAVLGLNPKENLFVSDQGEWHADYIPAYVRRYPFISVRTAADQWTLCLDENAARVNRSGQGAALFSGDEITPFLEQQKQFAYAFEIELIRNKKLSELLTRFDLLEQSQLVANKGPSNKNLTGFYVVSREKLNALAPQDLSHLQNQGALELIFLHLFSLERFEELNRVTEESQSSECIGA